MKRAAWLLAVAAATAGSTLPRAAQAYVRYYTEDNAPFAWALPQLPLDAYVDDFNQPTMSASQVVGAVTAAAAAWSAGTNACTYLNIVPQVFSGPAPRAANDAHNSLIFRSHSWCQLAPDGSCEVQYDISALAFTWDTANKKTGQIYDADIEVNLIDYQWADVVANPSLSVDMDLQNALTHELGHFIGLDHTCYSPQSLTTAGPPLDNNGVPVPACGDAPTAVVETTMYPSAMPGDTQKRTLAPDDQNGLCTIYPVADPPPGPNEQLRGCALDGSPRRPIGAAAVVGAAAILIRRRRRRA